MAVDVPLRCSCGALRGIAKEVAPERGNRIVCYCNDCQAFAHYLGRSDDMLNADGGTDIYQLSPARIKITEGENHLACMRLTPKGLMRWYASCCNTPVGNTMATAKAPFCGMMALFTDHEAQGQPRDVTAGPVRAHVNGQVGFVGDGGRKLSFFEKAGVLWHAVSLLLKGWVRGEARPSPFFADDGTPRVKPIVLSADERAELARRVGG